MPVVAWQIVGLDSVPVFPGDNPNTDGNAMVLIEMPDGRLLEPGSGEWDDLDTALEGALRRAVKRWECARKLKAAA